MRIYLNWLTSLNVFLIFLISITEGLRTNSTRTRNSHSSNYPCPTPRLKNGKVRMQRGGRMASFECYTGFDIHGPMNIACQTGRWKQEIPICIKPGCQIPSDRTNGSVMMDEKKQTVMLFCQNGYLSAGSTMAYCNGRQWDRELGNCRPDKGHTKVCDFETNDLCEWIQDPENEFPWLRKNGWTSFEKIEFGPKHDHTIGKPLEGHYMVAEGTNSLTTQKSRLWSPFYTSSDSENACFRFYYHMYGSKIGRLRVLLKPYDINIDDLDNYPKYQLFVKQKSQGNQWHQALFKIETLKQDFQIIFEATGSNGLINDIAIDDVALLHGSDCLGVISIDNEESDGIFAIQSCADRCTEKQSVRLNGSYTIINASAITEKCDCHEGCLDLGTCCVDYQSKCLENELETDMSTTPIDETPTEKSVMIEKTTQKIVKSTIPTSTIKSTPMSTSTSKLTSIPKPTLNTTLTPKLTPLNTTITTTKATVKPTMRPTVKPTFKPTLKPNLLPAINLTTILTPKPVPTMAMKIPNVIVNASNSMNSTAKLLPTKSTRSTTKITERITNPTLPMKISPPTKSSIQTTKQTKPTISTHKPVPKSIPTTIEMVTIAIKQSSRRAIPTQSSSITNSTLNAMLLPSDNSRIASLSSIIVICFLITVMLIGWRYFNATKWNQFNSQQIEFKSNYAADESLIRNDSFTLDDSFNETLITDLDVDDCASGNGIKVDSSTVYKKTTLPKVSKRSANKPKKNSNRTSKECDIYSEKRCLTADDELFDFTPQIL